ncbi:MAG: hypothetical protein QOH06_1418 [Acidobacteriota bacterium]|nr:hypothetical protein [Acidobacteriota bacterium]
MTSTRLRFRWIAALAMLALMAGPAGGAGEIGDTQAQTPFVSTDISVTLVEIPVEVTQGNEPVRGLTAADFEVFEGKRSLPIVSFETVNLEAPPEADAPPPPPAARRHVLFLFDFALSRPERLLDGIAAARELVEKDLDPRDMVAVGLYLPKGELPLLLSFTSDRAAARRTLEGLEGVLTGKIPEKSDASDPLRLTGLNARTLLTQVWRVDERNFARDMLASLGSSSGGFRWGDFLQKNVLSHSSVLDQMNVESRQRSHVKTMVDAIDGLAKVLRPVEGRKFLALFSEGFGSGLIDKPSESTQNPNMGGSDLVVHLEKMFEEMRRSGWVLHAVDIAGARRISADGLFYMANETGGKLVEGTNDLAKGLGGAMRRSAHSYLVSVQVDDVPFDGSYHKLEVKLRNAPNAQRGTRIHHRGGYFAPVPFQQQDGIQRLADAARLVAGDEESDDLGVSVVAVPMGSGGETTPVAVLLEVSGQRLLAPGGQRLGIEVYGYALDEKGSSHDFFAQSVDLDPSKVGSRLAQGGVRILGKLDLPRGEHRLRVLVRDRSDGRTSLLTVPVGLHAESEDHIDALFLPPAGDPWILVRPPEAELNLHGRSVVPAAQAALPASGEAQLLVVGYGLADQGEALRSRILGADGKPAAGGQLELLAVTAGKSGEPDLVVGRLSAGSLPPGSYLLELRLGNQPRAKAVSARPFRVAAAIR